MSPDVAENSPQSPVSPADSTWECFDVDLSDGVAHVQAGAGLVADSVPATEHEECRNKAAAVLDAITMAEGLRPAGQRDATMTPPAPGQRARDDEE